VWGVEVLRERLSPLNAPDVEVGLVSYRQQASSVEWSEIQLSYAKLVSSFKDTQNALVFQSDDPDFGVMAGHDNSKEREKDFNYVLDGVCEEIFEFSFQVSIGLLNLVFSNVALGGEVVSVYAFHPFGLAFLTDVRVRDYFSCARNEPFEQVKVRWLDALGRDADLLLRTTILKFRSALILPKLF